MRSPRVLISILNWNGGDTTLECLRSVFQLEYPYYEVAVLDNASIDGSAAKIILQFPRATLIESPHNVGFTGGHNLIIKRGLQQDFDYFWVLNNDAVVAPQSLGKIVAAMEQNAQIGLASPTVYFRDTPDRVQFCGSWFDWATLEIRHSRNFDEIAHYEQTIPQSMCLWGTAMMLRREMIERVGTFNERYFAYYEDAELSLRCARAGFVNKVVFDAEVWHRSPLLTKDRSPHFFYYMTRNGYWFWQTATHGFDRVRAWRRHFARTLRLAAKCGEDGLNECRRACILGFRDALLHRPGCWDSQRQAPRLLGRAFGWHPYLLASLLEGEFGAIADQVAKRLAK